MAWRTFSQNFTKQSEIMYKWLLHTLLFSVLYGFNLPHHSTSPTVYILHAGNVFDWQRRLQAALFQIEIKCTAPLNPIWLEVEGRP